MTLKQLSLFSFILLLGLSLSAQDERYNHSKFKQLQYELSTPNVYRTASGAPGHMYWQQQADYVIEVTLDDENQTISGEETITYHNNSPDALSYL
ncbi:MAG: M1 family peptidase, partial [Bacteroidota bacterium]